MEKLTLAEVVKAVQGRLVRGNADAEITGVSTDTRTLAPGDVFFALVGENADGHLYVSRALEAGAGALVVSDESAIPADVRAPVILVEDPLWALGDLAAFYRSRFDVRVVGVTGSVGKTTTKEMLGAILQRKWSVLKNEMNFNNEIGVPQTLFQLDRGHEVVVLEMAMRGIGEIRRLAQIARPEVGLITNVGLSHIERLGSQGAIADAKAELLQELPPDGLAVLNAEDGYFNLMTERFGGRVLSFGSCDDADVCASRILQASDGRCECVIRAEAGEIGVSLPVVGYYNVYNAIAAAAVAVGMGVELETIKDGLESYTQPSMRMELTRSRRGFTVLNDSYNASPSSMIAALKTLQALVGYKRTIAVLGDMLELGDYAPKAHWDVGAAAVRSGVVSLVAVGPLAAEIAAGAKDAGLPDAEAAWYPDSSAAASQIGSLVRKGDAVLVKGSRAMKMEQIVRALLDE
ncbi:MAG: UDP-N-acetylmuramoyl-tripeptide--D-alanyl-D-alanine ligase [Armatimonadetes bacterium]|nr:UDP-N-acetylmuramoyl-tripeptide--D-alanyl-D-alanine ligase [Armatimonadota bacterium]